MIKTCQRCGAEFDVRPYRFQAAKFCGKSCAGHDAVATRGLRNPNLKGNQHRKGKRPANAFQPGHATWNRGLRGIHLSPDSEFKPGQRPINHTPVGTVRIRKRDSRGEARAWVKVAEPNKWKLRAVAAWESVHGSLPRGLVIHHVDRDTLNDDPSNLEAVSRSDHMREHSAELATRRRAHAGRLA